MSVTGQDRKQREREFHDVRFAEGGRDATRRFYEVDAGKQRFRSLLAQLFRPGVRVLEYGCGAGTHTRGLADGARVTAIDLSPVAIRRSHARAGSKSQVTFAQMDAEALAFRDESFDVVCGSGILHHLDLHTAYTEIARVLTPGGTALFVEPQGHNPLINLYRRLTPSMRTIDEHPLVVDDIALAERIFGHVRVEHYDLLALAAVAVRRLPGATRMISALHAVDAWLFRRLPRSSRWAWMLVLELGDPLPPPGPPAGR